MASEIRIVKFVNGVMVKIDHGNPAIDLVLKKIKTQESISNISGVDAVLPSPDSSFVRLSNALLESVLTINPSTENELLLVYNGTGRAITIKRTGNIITGSEEDLVLESTASILLYQIKSLNKYAIIGGSGSGGGSKKVVGSVADPLILEAGESIPFSGFQDTLVYIAKSDGGKIDLSAINPQIQNGTKVSQELWIVCIDGDDIFQLANGNNLIMSGPYLSNLNSLIRFMWLGNGWLDITRQY